MSEIGLWSKDEFPAGAAVEIEEPGAPPPPASAPETPAAPASEVTPAESKFTRVIDLGDGSGVQKFEAETADELIEKLASAQEHATRKIRALNARLKLGEGAPPPSAPAATPSPSPKPLTAEEAFAIGEQLKTDPGKAFESLMSSQLGMSPAQLRQAVEEARQLRANMQEREHAHAFVAAHPEYHISPKNGEKMQRYIELHRLPATLDSFERAFKDLSESGLLELGEREPKPETARIAPPAETQRRPSQGAIPPRNSARPAVNHDQGLPSEEEAAKMPLAELRARLVSHWASQ